MWRAGRYDQYVWPGQPIAPALTHVMVSTTALLSLLAAVGHSILSIWTPTGELGLDRFRHGQKISDSRTFLTAGIPPPSHAPLKGCWAELP